MNKMQSAKRYGTAIGSIALYLLISALYKGEYIYTVLQQICCFFVAVMGINFITGMTGQPMMGAAGVLAIGAYTTGILSSYGWNPFWALIPVILISALIGVGLGYPSLRLSGVLPFLKLSESLLRISQGLLAERQALKISQPTDYSAIYLHRLKINCWFMLSYVLFLHFLRTGSSTLSGGAACWLYAIILIRFLLAELTLPM